MEQQGVDAAEGGSRLVLTKRLACGGMAEVYLGEERGIGGFQKQVAVKRILPAYSQEPTFRVQFLQETTLCASLQHPNIVQVHRNGEMDGELFLVMEYVRGATLSQVQRRLETEGRKLDPALACLAIAQAARGLHFAHTFVEPRTGTALQVVHRDISPSNLMVGFSGTIKVMDFGIAKAVGHVDTTRTGELKGKVSYMSPEQLAGTPLDARTDVFSLGAVLFELLSGTSAFKGKSPANTMHRVLTHRPASVADLPGCDDELDLILAQALAKDRDDRFASARDMQRALARWLSVRHPDLMDDDLGALLGELFPRTAQGDSSEIHDGVPSMSKSRLLQLRSIASEGDPTIATRAEAGDLEPLTEVQLEGDGTLTGAAVLALEPDSRPPIRWSRVAMVSVAALLVFMPAYYWVLGRADAPPAAIVPPPPLRVEAPVAAEPAPAQPAALVGPRLIAQWSADEAVSERGGVVLADTQRKRQARPPTLAASPRLLPDRLNGYSVLRFEGQQFLEAGEVARDLRAGSAMSVVTVARKSKNKKHYLWSVHGNNRVRDISRFGFNEFGEPEFLVNHMQYVRPNDSVETSVWAVSALVVEGTHGVAYYAGEKVAETWAEKPLPYEDATYFSIGQEWDDVGPSDLFVGDVAEVRIYGSALTDRQRVAIEKELSDKYSL